jgi:hypothetical protein
MLTASSPENIMVDLAAGGAVHGITIINFGASRDAAGVPQCVPDPNISCTKRIFGKRGYVCPGGLLMQRVHVLHAMLVLLQRADASLQGVRGSWLLLVTPCWPTPLG